MTLTEFSANLFSKDESTKVAAFILGHRDEILGYGYNGFVRGMNDDRPDWKERPQKYFYSEHAERNAVYNSTTDLRGTRIYVSGLPPCADCARAIAQKGIAQVVVRSWCPHSIPERWKDSFNASYEILHLSNIEVVSLGQKEEEMKVITPTDVLLQERFA